MTAPSFPHHGLLNTGVTGYCTTLLHSMYHWPQFRETAVLAAAEVGEEPKASNTSLSVALMSILGAMESASADAPPVDLAPLFLAMGWGKAELEQPHDIHEFMVLFLNALEEESPTWKQYRDTYVTQKRGTTVLGVENQEKLSSRSEVGFTLDVSGKLGTLEAAIADAFVTERLAGDNQYQHPTTRKMMDADLIPSLEQPLPKILAIQVKRFDLCMKTYSMVKTFEKFTAPLTLDLAAHIPSMKNCADGAKPVPFQLFSVVTHQGTTQSGHFATIARDVDTTEWACCHDHRVTKLGGGDAEAATFGQGGGGTMDPCSVLLFYAATTAKTGE